MNYTYIKFTNITLAQLASSILAKEGFASRLRRNPNPNHVQGCNYALYVSGDVFEAHAIIAKNNVQNLGVESYRDSL
ncbi:MAG: hypothetical protein R3Y27_03655 [Clostridia bacterium]